MEKWHRGWDGGIDARTQWDISGVGSKAAMNGERHNIERV